MRVMPLKDELLGVTDGCYSVNIPINDQIIKDAPSWLIVGYKYKVRLQQQFDEAWFAGVWDRYHGKINPIFMMKGNVKCLQYCTTCANNQPNDTRLSIDAWSEDINDNVRSSIHKVYMWWSGDSARPPGDLFRQH